MYAIRSYYGLNPDTCVFINQGNTFLIEKGNRITSYNVCYTKLLRFIGSVILKEALERGHLVTAIVRNPQKINLNHSNLIIKECDVLVPENVEIHTKGNDVVISAYNPGWTNTNIAEDTTKAYRSIIEGIKKAEIPRLLIVGGAGSYNFV